MEVRRKFASKKIAKQNYTEFKADNELHICNNNNNNNNNLLFYPQKLQVQI